MIQVDSSVWIDYFKGIDSQQWELLDKMLGTELVVIGDLISIEVLQGFRHDEHSEKASELFSALTIFNMLGRGIALASAENFRYLRKQGRNTVRATKKQVGQFLYGSGHT